VNHLRALARSGLLGINRRNAEYTLRWNERRLYPRVDDKILSKQICAEAGIPTPSLLAVARVEAEVPAMLDELSRQERFALKPARGSMGNGILVAVERVASRFRRASGGWLDSEALRFHASSIISGLYSLGGLPDAAFAEECLQVHRELRAISYEGVPDIRVVVHRGIPVMAMIRLPTAKSRGRANLHQGAVGVGIDLGSGLTTHAVFGTRPVRLHPDTEESVVGRALPDFDRVLEYAVRATDATGLGYVGADVVIDEHHGPLILEMNARPGLAIQIANQEGLLPRLRAVAERLKPGMSLDERLALGREIGSPGA